MATDPDELRQARLAVLKQVLERWWEALTTDQLVMLSDMMNDLPADEFAAIMPDECHRFC